uniref:ribosome silencing factor n=1 Tax=Piscicoccus intestinalis TaxID=746033 RepID=UPI0008385908|nr:ribosome silencing factor [Piscicoccus intestinalis]
MVVTASQTAKDLAQIAASAAEDKLATDIVALDVSGQFPLSDVFVIASVANERQVPSVVDSVEEKLREAGVKPLRREGEREGRWVLLDFGDIIVHLQHEEERGFYQLERLWKDCPVIPLRLGPPDDAGDSAGDSAGDAAGAGEAVARTASRDRP